MKKLLLTGLIIFAVITISFIFFNTTYAAVNEIRDFIGGAENVMENAASGATNMVKNGANTISNTMNDFMNDDDMNNTNETTGAWTMDNNNTNYTAQRTAVTGDNVTVLGISVNMWTLIIITVSIVGLVTLIWSYIAQQNNHHSSYYDE